MWVLQLIENSDIIEFDIQILIHALQSTANGDVIFEFNRDRVIHKGFEEAEEQHCNLRELWWRSLPRHWWHPWVIGRTQWSDKSVRISPCAGSGGSRATKARSQSSLSLAFSKNPSVT